MHLVFCNCTKHDRLFGSTVLFSQFGLCPKAQTMSNQSMDHLGELLEGRNLTHGRQNTGYRCHITALAWRLCALAALHSIPGLD